MMRFFFQGVGATDLESLFLSHLSLIERISRSVAQRYGYQSDDAEDFSSHVKTRFLDNNYAVLRKFQGRSSLSLYIKTVIHRLWIDYEIKRTGKWRSSSTARKIGPIAVQLEELLYRKRYTFEEAYQILNSRHGTCPPRDTLSLLIQKLPKRWGKASVRMVSLDGLDPAKVTTAAEIQDPKTGERVEILRRVLTDFMDRLAGADRMILKMRFEDDFTFEEIGRLLKKKKLQVYWRIRKLLSDIEKELHAHGLAEDAVREIIDQRVKAIHVDFLNRDTQQSEKCPSKQDESSWNRHD